MNCDAGTGKTGAEVPTVSGESATELELLTFLKKRGYRFVTPAPATHARVLARSAPRRARNLPEIFGWSMPFDPPLLDRELLRRPADAGLIEESSDAFRSRVRVASLDEELFLHSAYPTEGHRAVFFGPDSYRFARLITQELTRCPPPHGAKLADVGTGTGAGAIIAARHCLAAEIVMTDINSGALRLARINAAAAGVPASFCLADDLSPIAGEIDLALANRPYMIDAARRAVRRLAVGGWLILYTASSIVDGKDSLQQRLADIARELGCALRHEEIDPDVFGEELESEVYQDVERIAVVAAIIERGETFR